MWVEADIIQVCEETKERNRYFNTLKEIRQIAVLQRDKNICLEAKQQFNAIVQKCNNVLKETESDNL
jgi:hypothetical protein